MEHVKHIRHRVDPRAGQVPTEDTRAARLQFKTEMEHFAAAYRHELTDEAIRVYWLALKDVPVDVRTEGLTVCLRTQKFFPTVAEILTACADVIDDRRAKARRLADQLVEHCGVCDPNQKGWVSLVKDNVESVKRCKCFLQGQQLIAEAGEPLKRPALPEAQVQEA